MGDSTTLRCATQHLASVNRRFSLTLDVAPDITHMSYNDNVLNHELLTKKRRCKVIFVCGTLYSIFIVKDIPLLPIQVILYQLLKKSGRGRVAEAIAISKAYLRLPDRPPAIWDLAPAEQPLFLDLLAEVKILSPHAAKVLDRLHPAVPLIHPAPPIALPSVPATVRSGSTRTTRKSFLSVRERENIHRSKVIFHAIHTISKCARRLGYDCFLAGSGYVPWYVMGSPVTLMVPLYPL